MKSGIVCAGNWIVDLVHRIERWPQEGDLVRIIEQSVGVGGGAANVCSDLVSLGARFPVTALGCLGDDAHALVVQQHLQRLGVSDAGLHRLAGTATAHTHVMSVRGGCRTFFYTAGANDRFGPEHVPVQALADAGHKLFYLGYLLLLGTMDQLQANGDTLAAQTLRAARAAGMTTCVDLVSEHGSRFAQVLQPALPHIDHLIINEIEAERAAQLGVRTPDGRLSADGLQRAARKLLDGGVQQSVIVHAPEGALWQCKDGESFWAEPAPVDGQDIVSAVGAGDAFCAAVLWGLHEGWHPDATLRRAHGVAAACLRGHTATDGIPTMSAVLAREAAVQARPLVP